MRHDSAGKRQRVGGGQPIGRSGLSTLGFVVGILLWCLILAALWLIVVKKRSDAPKADSDTADSETAQESVAIKATTKSVVISFPSRELPEFELLECMGGTVSRESLRGRRWVANFVFTRCAGPCPLMTRDISELHRRVASTSPDFRFVTFTVDPTVDTPEVLKKYADTFLADHDRWKFVTGDENQLYDLIRRGFVQLVIPEVPENRLPGFEVAHSNRAVLVNENCIPVATFVMTVPEDVVRLRRIIEGKEEFPTPGTGLRVPPADGENPPVQLNLIPVGAGGSPEQKADFGAAAPENHEPATQGDLSSSADETDSENSESAEVKNARIDLTLPAWVARMPSINAVLNLVCTALLLAGFAAIKHKKRTTHRNLMISAFLVSSAFLTCYLTYHEALYRFTGLRGRAFVGSEFAAAVYRVILIPHVILAACVPILALRVFWLAWRGRWAAHRRLATITLPIWLFVSITGVVIYAMLYHWPWRTAAHSFATGVSGS